MAPAYRFLVRQIMSSTARQRQEYRRVRRQSLPLRRKRQLGGYVRSQHQSYRRLRLAVPSLTTDELAAAGNLLRNVCS